MAANLREKQILTEGFKNAVVSLTGVLNTSDENWVDAIRLSDFINNDSRMGALVGLRIDGVEFSVADPASLMLYWNSDSPQTIGAYAQSGELDYRTRGAGKQPDRTRSGYTGSINVATVGYMPGGGRAWMVTLTVTKLYA